MPIVSESDYKRTENLVEEFLKKNGTGYFLQNLLQNFSNEKDNWVRIFQFFSILF